MRHLVDAHGLIWCLAQSKVESVPIISIDAALDQYLVTRIW
jgi:hypothetical protein